MSTIAIAPLLAAVAVLGICGWIYRDARANLRAGTPVVAQLGSLRIETPEAWATACVLVFIVFIPLYLVARNGSL